MPEQISERPGEELLVEPFTMDDGRVVKLMRKGGPGAVWLIIDNSHMFYPDTYVEALGEGDFSEGLRKLGQSAFSYPDQMTGHWDPATHTWSPF